MNLKKQKCADWSSNKWKLFLKERETDRNEKPDSSDISNFKTISGAENMSTI